MIKFQSWLDSTCRDVLDESDVSLAVKNQLIYPSGQLMTVDGHPHRWRAVQVLLALVKNYLPEFQRKFPRSIEVIPRDQGFPMIYILQTDVEEDLHERILDEICGGRVEFLRFADCPVSTHDVEIRKVILGAHLDKQLLQQVAALFIDKTVASKMLLLVRGLIQNRILLLCLKKRWNVKYGLHPGRNPIAVPYEAKGVPSEQAEFGHPDAAIIYTCLAFYYAGINLVQFNQGLSHVLASHDPSSEYERWTSSCKTLPDALCHSGAVNSEDQGQVEELWKHLRTSTSVLDHYMNHFVFPLYAKHFSRKLQASGWDLPLFTREDYRGNVATTTKTTGFSGTNDNRLMLPLTIKQHDLPSLHQTNAEVLTYLLQQRNQEYHLAVHAGERCSEREFLAQLMGKGIRILIDAGAYILEMSNEALVKAWLDIDPEPVAAVYFGPDNRAWVHYRGLKEAAPLLATPFADNMEECLVYLDEAHTRGIDLKLPKQARGALTLAVGQTKDHTVQAAMRLRQLATTQSLCFFASPETHHSILDVCKITDQDRVTSSHVVYWLLEQTCRANEQLQGLYLSQGTDFCNRTTERWEHPNFLHNSLDRASYVKVLQHQEQQTLEQLYGGFETNAPRFSSSQTTSARIQYFRNELAKLRYASAGGNTTRVHSSLLEEIEHEREAEKQVEEVREVHRPVHHKPGHFPGLHPAIWRFAQTSMLTGGEGYEHVFKAVSRTRVGQKFGIKETESRLFTSVLFKHTIKMSPNAVLDNYLRPVEYILYNSVFPTALVVIAEETELLIKILRTEGFAPGIHILTYSAPISKQMLHFSNLNYYALPALPDGHVIPQWLTIELGIFAGRLYMEYEEVAPLIQYLEHTVVTEKPCAKMTSFLLEWLSLRRKVNDITYTPMGYVCEGRPLDRSHAFFAKSGYDDLPGGDSDDGSWGGDSDGDLLGGDSDDGLWSGYSDDGLWGRDSDDSSRGGGSDDDLRDGHSDDGSRSGYADDDLESGDSDGGLRGGDSEDDLRGGRSG